MDYRWEWIKSSAPKPVDGDPSPGTFFGFCSLHPSFRVCGHRLGSSPLPRMGGTSPGMDPGGGANPGQRDCYGGRLGLRVLEFRGVLGLGSR